MDTSKPNDPYALRKRPASRTDQREYSERQEAVIKALTRQGHTLRDSPTYSGDFRVVGDQITLDIDVIEKLLGLR
jgi:hypothetical protein